MADTKEENNRKSICLTHISFKSTFTEPIYCNNKESIYLVTRLNIKKVNKI